MEITVRDLMSVVHGMMFGIFFLMAVFGIVVMLCRSMVQLQQPAVAESGYKWEQAYLIATVVLGWAAVLSGAYIVYPWYRAIPPAGVASLARYPQALLKSSSTTVEWHALGMEWKEHISWMAPIVMTMAAYVLTRHRRNINGNRQLRTTVLAFTLIALLAAGIAGVFGALIDKAAPVEGGSTINLMQGAK